MANKNIKKLRNFSIIITILFVISFFILVFSYTDNLVTALTPNSLPEKRTDIVVEINKEDLDLLEKKYVEDPNEYLFCLIGTQEEDKFIINSIEEVEGEATESEVISKEFRVCQGEKYIGTLHKHPPSSFIKRFRFNIRNWQPSSTDLFNFGDIRLNLHIIQFDKDKFYASEYTIDKRLDFKSILIEVKDG